MKKQHLLISAAFISSFTIEQKKPAEDLNKSVLAGKEIYSINCKSCHQEKVKGLEGIYPPPCKI